MAEDEAANDGDETSQQYDNLKDKVKDDSAAAAHVEKKDKAHVEKGNKKETSYAETDGSREVGSLAYSVDAQGESKLLRGNGGLLGRKQAVLGL